MKRQAVISCAGFIASALFMTSGSQAYAESVQVRAEKAEMFVGEQTNKPIIHVKLTFESARDFAIFTSARVDKRIHVKLDGKLLTSPVVSAPLLAGQMGISVDTTPEAAKAIADRMLSGGKLTVEDEAGE